MLSGPHCNSNKYTLIKYCQYSESSAAHKSRLEMPTSFYNGVENNTHPSWWKDPCLRKNAFWLAVCSLTSVYIGYDGSLLNGVQALPKFYETFPVLERDSNVLGITGAAQFLPGLVTPFIASWICDKWGRKGPLIATAIGICAGAVIQATSKSLGQFIFSRVFIGAFGMFGQTAAGPMIVELAHPRVRGTWNGLNLTCYYIGSIIASWTTFGILQNFPESSWSWRLPSLLQCMIPGLLILPLCFLPESPRYLLVAGKKERATQILSNQHANGKLDDPLVLLEIHEIEYVLDMERNATKGSGSDLLDLIRTRGNRWRLWCVIHVAFGAQWSGANIIGYYFVPVMRSIGIVDPTPQTLVSGGLSISNWLFALGGAFNMDRAGRRGLFLGSTGSMLVILVLVIGLSALFLKDENPAVGGATVGLLYLFYGAYSVAWTPLNIGYPVEILPYSLRTKGMAVWTFFACLALCVNTWVNPVALSAIGFHYYIVYVGILIYLFVVIYLTFPETKGLSLEEIAIRFDGEEAQEMRNIHPEAGLELADDSEGKVVPVEHVESVRSTTGPSA
ncbi:general substrate transporter [Papiliotrema laurentii]|uniref:General substrate transporter n=1 Tax=Papiliotrema laurentii TaxID=5418 RepID=A0AAD9CUX4_PAPLA|nr:general substrate transporter [Papiliotrema laurentii]